jgi:hypothetical protein
MSDDESDDEDGAEVDAQLWDPQPEAPEAGQPGGELQAQGAAAAAEGGPMQLGGAAAAAMAAGGAAAGGAGPSGLGWGDGGGGLGSEEDAEDEDGGAVAAFVRAVLRRHGPALAEGLAGGAGGGGAAAQVVRGPWAVGLGKGKGRGRAGRGGLLAAGQLSAMLCVGASRVACQSRANRQSPIANRVPIACCVVRLSVLCAAGRRRRPVRHPRLRRRASRAARPVAPSLPRRLAEPRGTARCGAPAALVSRWRCKRRAAGRGAGQRLSRAAAAAAEPRAAPRAQKAGGLLRPGCRTGLRQGPARCSSALTSPAVETEERCRP